ncbi:hypothetical protein ACFSHQ_12270 [Gemmobacter lanyuensis]
MSGAASAQSVLERVLTSINDTNSNMKPVTGTFANIAENIAVLGPTEVTQYNNGEGGILTQAEYEALVAANQAAATAAGTTAANAATALFQDWDGDGPAGATWSTDSGATTFASEAAALAAVSTAAYNTYMATASSTAYDPEVVTVGNSQILNAIDGSITNTMTGIQEATADVGSVYAFDEVTVDIGDLSTTVLGAVNTGDITLGVNQDVSEAISGTSSAVSSSIRQLGGVTDQTALVLNVASNATDVIGSVNNSFESLNGSIGNVSTTVLGAVNTGTITSGINAAVTGVQSGIVGTN